MLPGFFFHCRPYFLVFSIVLLALDEHVLTHFHSLFANKGFEVLLYLNLNRICFKDLRSSWIKLEFLFYY